MVRGSAAWPSWSSRSSVVELAGRCTSRVYTAPTVQLRSPAAGGCTRPGPTGTRPPCLCLREDHPLGPLGVLSMAKQTCAAPGRPCARLYTSAPTEPPSTSWTRWIFYKITLVRMWLPAAASPAVACCPFLAAGPWSVGSWVHSGLC